MILKDTKICLLGLALLFESLTSRKIIINLCLNNSKLIFLNWLLILTLPAPFCPSTPPANDYGDKCWTFCLTSWQSSSKSTASSVAKEPREKAVFCHFSTFRLSSHWRQTTRVFDANNSSLDNQICQFIPWRREVKVDWIHRNWRVNKNRSSNKF